MAPKKLTEADKTSILKLYREPEETTSTLADRYGVSNSTISRLLKASLPAKEYSRLIQQKRSSADKPSASTAKGQAATSAPVAAPSPEPEPEAPGKAEKPAPVLKKRDEATAPAAEPTPVDSQADETDKPASAKRTRRRAPKAEPSPAEEAAQLSIPEPEEETPEPPKPSSKEPPKLKSERVAAAADQADMTESIPTDWDAVSNLDDDYDEDDDDDDDDYEEDGDSWDGEEATSAPHLEKLEIAPLTEASLPQLCYVVVERSSSELVVLPLRTFGHLGEIPEAEGESRTLPVFDNHRVARRFSRRNQRVVKLPDGGLLQTTSPYLMAKGITRLLIDGQVFALEEDDGYEEETNFE